MDTWTNICAGICAIKPSDQAGQYIFPAKRCKIWPQIMSVWPNSIDDKADCHTDKKVGCAVIKLTAVFKEEIGDSDKNIGKPEKVRDCKNLQKWYFIIQIKLDNRKLCCKIFFPAMKTKAYKLKNREAPMHDCIF